MIEKLECDMAMAVKKGLLPCEKKCLQCHACIKKDLNGQREHVNFINKEYEKYYSYKKKGKKEIGG